MNHSQIIYGGEEVGGGGQTSAGPFGVQTLQFVSFVCSLFKVLKLQKVCVLPYFRRLDPPFFPSLSLSIYLSILTNCGDNCLASSACKTNAR